ncbi:hypothetical protein TrVE_jg12801 [Triparma verrucosa]|uniref:Uncharacterized protein n=2 Tax=Triparma TaxID=722752 RepID=A0A9W7BTJ8_9STRA|nr:hypothetical protein TrST_g14200 [Triparma strigata]GMI05763.1 hypothetical protein TrVE_jg12801 [Triparma verrucosa]
MLARRAFLRYSPLQGPLQNSRRTFFSKITRSAKKLAGVELTEAEKRDDQIDKVFEQATANAPPGVKLISKLMKPLVSKFMNMAAESQQEIQHLHDSTRELISHNHGLSSALGGGELQFSPPFQQFQSNVNGRKETTLQMQVYGKSQGVVMLSARDGKITSLRVEVEGRIFDVGTKPPERIKGGRSRSRFSSKRDNVAEGFVEADFKEK